MYACSEPRPPYGKRGPAACGGADARGPGYSRWLLRCCLPAAGAPGGAAAPAVRRRQGAARVVQAAEEPAGEALEVGLPRVLLPLLAPPVGVRAQALVGLGHDDLHVVGVELGVGLLLLVRQVGTQDSHLHRVDQVAQELLAPLQVPRLLQLAAARRLEVRVGGVPGARVGQDHGPHRGTWHESALFELQDGVAVAGGALREEQQWPAAGRPLLHVIHDRLHRRGPGGLVRAVHLDDADLLREVAYERRLQRTFHGQDLGRPEECGQDHAVQVAHVVGHDERRLLHVAGPIASWIIGHGRNDAVR
mmetsp:Transcript_90192/g.263758  ORF Transcript_90192/g.263758 Transcript_90192/m.263758 type:complete len:305 (+) Transcript_90192:3-917(+)